jgi:hypothetical protein
MMGSGVKQSFQKKNEIEVCRAYKRNCFSVLETLLAGWIATIKVQASDMRMQQDRGQEAKDCNMPQAFGESKLRMILNL